MPQCQDDDAGACTLAALRTSNDPEFSAPNIRCGSKLLGITGTYGSGSSSPFTFTDVTNAALSTLTTASAVTIGGIPAGCPGEVTVAEQGSPQISIGGGAWGTSGSISNGQTLAVRLTSSASLASIHSATVSIGSSEDTWSVTTLAADTTPDAYNLTDVTNANPSTLTASNSVTISGINTATTVSATGGAEFRINGGSWGTSGTITNGQTLEVRLTSSASFSTAVSSTVTVGTVSDTWSVTTLAADTMPAAFDFAPDVTGTALSTLTTASAVTISGINASTPVSVTGTGAQISIAGGAWGTSGNITNGQTLAVRLTSSASYSTQLTATINVGGVTDTWSVTTIPNVTPGSTTYSTPGTYSFTVPNHNSLQVELWGSGGGGADWYAGYVNGSAAKWDGGAASGKPEAGGGLGAGWGSYGVGGTAANCDVNTAGGNGHQRADHNESANRYLGNPWGGQTWGGNGANGGAGGQAPTSGNYRDGNAPGGGGSGWYYAGENIDGDTGNWYGTQHMQGSGGGGGAYCKKTYASGVYVTGGTVTVVVPVGGIDTYYGSGARGQVKITWN